MEFGGRAKEGLELDAPPNDPNAVIIGGEYIDDASVGADRLTVPPFVWASARPSSYSGRRRRTT